jgi:hypothetical protein
MGSIAEKTSEVGYLTEKRYNITIQNDVHFVYPAQLEIKDTPEADKSTCRFMYFT